MDYCSKSLKTTALSDLLEIEFKSFFGFLAKVSFSLQFFDGVALTMLHT
jgi:hypothetical protein